MLHDRDAQEVDVVSVDEQLQIDHFAVAPALESSVEVQHVRDPPLMPAAKLRPVRPSTTTRPPVMYSQP